MRSLYATLLVGLLAAPALAQNARSSVQIDTTTKAAYPTISSFGDLTAAAYVDDDNSDWIYVTTSSDDSLSWSTPVRVDSGPGAERRYLQPWSIVVSGDNIYVAWIDERHGTSNDELFFNYSTDRGVNWAGEQRIQNGYTEGAGAVRDWRFTVSAGAPIDDLYFVISVDPDTGSNEELYATVGDAMTLGTFLAPVHIPVLAAGTADVDGIDAIAYGSNLYVTWQDNRNGIDDVWYQISIDRGQTWHTFDTQVDDPLDTTGDAQYDPSIEVMGATVLVAWQEQKPAGAPEQLRANVSQTYGGIWNGDTQIGGYVPGTHDVDSAEAMICLGRPFIVWDDDRTGDDEIYVTVSTDAGATWMPDTRLSTAGGGFPRIGRWFFGRVGICWTSGFFPNFAETAYTPDAGFNWITVAVSDTTGDADFCEMAFNYHTDNLVALWLSDDLGANNAYAGGYSICGPATTTFRNGGTNPVSYTATTAVLGDTFTGTVDLATTGHGFALLVGYSTPFSFVLGGGQTLLVNIADPNGELFGQPLTPGPTAVFDLDVPNWPSLCGFAAATQAVHWGGMTPFALSNAQDLVLGAL